MMISVLENGSEIVIGFGSGFVVGSGFVAFLTVLGIIPRLVQLSKSSHALKLYQIAVIIGAMVGVYITFTDTTLSLPIIFLMIWGFIHGIFIGMLAAALTEILNVFPLLMKRLGIDEAILWLLMAIVIGKICGSLFHWIIFVDEMPK
ncbi:stage V sporulation protein AB [Gracilibacillus halophilus YIM-C55.5]|uniref:Stage V sporulation protein AB n=1 Tax=Gracilibacillus halophilus YIM-C55.5 TaxID=1308866 RepID=N4WMH8_9BACI|nr:stage V sporulation protein AB [Gracilibacillus halophilus]ENH97387.1 stage V sporulation protein AB [Gracilibacillus halophilus YIM-C55.5]